MDMEDHFIHLFSGDELFAWSLAVYAGGLLFLA
jgi:hypothetical protein